MSLTDGESITDLTRQRRKQSIARMTSDDIDHGGHALIGLGLPELRKAVSEPALVAGGIGRFSDRTLRRGNAKFSAEPRLVSSGGAAPRRGHVILVSALDNANSHEQQQQQQQQQQKKQQHITRIMNGADVGDATRSIDMIDLRNFPAIMTKHILRRRATTADNHLVRTASGLSHHNDICGNFSAAKYGREMREGPPICQTASACANSKTPRTTKGQGVTNNHINNPLHERPNVASRPHTYHQLGVSFPPNHAHAPHPPAGDYQHHHENGSEVSAAFPVVPTDLHSGAAGLDSVGSWQTYPLSSRLHRTHVTSNSLKGDKMVGHAHHVLLPGNNLLPDHATTHIRTRYSAPPHRAHGAITDAPKHAAGDDDNKRTDPDDDAQLAPRHQSAHVVVSKPTVDLLRKKQTPMANGNRTNNEGGVNNNNGHAIDVDLDDEADSDEDDANVRVRRWLSSLDNAVCQRYARRQMASLREYETSNPSAT